MKNRRSVGSVLSRILLLLLLLLTLMPFYLLLVNSFKKETDIIHDGFCLFDSALTDFKSTNTPLGRDIVAEFVEAVRAEGLKVGLYYSLLDWHHPDYPHFGDLHHPMLSSRCRKTSAAMLPALFYSDLLILYPVCPASKRFRQCFADIARSLAQAHNGGRAIHGGLGNR